MTNSFTQHIFFFAVFALVWTLMYFVLAPFLVPILLAVVFAVFFSGMHKYITSRVKHKSFAALTSLVIIVLGILVPLSAIGTLVFNEAVNMYDHLSSPNAAEQFSTIFSRFEGVIGEYAPNAKINIAGFVQNILQWLISHTATVFTGALSIIVDLFIFLIALFYMFRDGASLRSYLIHLSPLDTSDDEDIFAKVQLTIQSVVRGTLIIALIQGALAAIGFTLFGIGNPALWGVVSAVAALIPGLGTGLVNAPAAIYLFLSGNIAAGIGFIVWSFLVIGTVDNILAPKLIESKVNIHPFLILVSVIGGLLYFGPVGFLAGPILLAIAVELLKLLPKFGGTSRN